MRQWHHAFLKTCLACWEVCYTLHVVHTIGEVLEPVSEVLHAGTKGQCIFWVCHDELVCGMLTMLIWCYLNQLPLKNLTSSYW